MAREFGSIPVPCGNAADAGTAHDPSNGQFTSGGGGSSGGSSGTSKTIAAAKKTMKANSTMSPEWKKAREDLRAAEGEAYTENKFAHRNK